MNFAIKTFNELTIDELYEIVKSRFEVFVCEQKIIEDQEFDDKDKVSYHIMLKENDKVVAYCRIVPKEIGYDYTSIGRVLVLSSYRRKGIAQEMIKVALDFIKNNLNENTYKSMKKKIYQNIIFLYFSRLISSKYFLIKDIKQLMAGGGVALIGTTLVPLLSGLFG